MAKGKKNVLTQRKNPDDTIELKAGSRKETKENTPAMNQDYLCKSQSSLHTLWGPSKPRSPLSNSSSLLIKEGNESDTQNPDSSKLKKDKPNKVECDINESREEPTTEAACREIRKQTTEKPEEKDSTTRTNTESAAGSKISVSKPQSGAGHRVRAKKTENKSSQNRKVTDYYPIRRSNRKTKAELKNEEHGHIDDLIKNSKEEGMQVKHIEGKGRGVFASRGFKKGEFVVEYHGDLLDLAEAKIREAQYAQDPKTGCYMYYFQYRSKTYCVDATKETSRLGRLINHSKTGNCQTKLHAIDGTPHLILVASRDIEAEEELLYDYGDRSKASILAHPWLKY
ncbi:hypothetical protein LDENG_00166650 [Lucifuga dentata]|nr:hypothetical protein LDENG_00166650 [Lucifuga dentata]